MAVSLGRASFSEGLFIHPVLLDHAVRVRGKCWTDLARPEGPFSPTTVTKLRKGSRSLSPQTYVRLVEWLRATPVIPELEGLFTRPHVEGAA